MTAEKIKDEAKEIMAEVTEIKKVYHTKKWHVTWGFLLFDIVAFGLLVMVAVFMVLTVMFSSDYASGLVGYSLIVSILALFSAIYFPSVRQKEILNTYTYSHKVKDKTSVNKLTVALKNIKVKGIHVMNINTIYNGNDMYLEIKYK